MILFIAALLPMCGALISYLIGRRSKSARDYTAAAFALTEFALMLWLFVRALGGESFTCEIPYLLGRIIRDFAGNLNNIAPFLVKLLFYLLLGNLKDF